METKTKVKVFNSRNVNETINNVNTPQHTYT